MTTGCLVLVVEDDEDIRDVLATVLHEFGYSVIIARNGEEALQQLRSGACLPCVILLDLWMPVMNGWQFREEQRKDTSLAGIPVVALSGDSEARALDAEVHLSKPVQFDPLVNAVERFCGPGGHLSGHVPWTPAGIRGRRGRRPRTSARRAARRAG